MTKEEFNKFRSLAYPNTPPISHRFKDDYNDRWFRIHSLPNSKRYPDTENERNILLMRQNDIISDFLGEKSNTLLVTEGHDLVEEKDIYKNYNFTKLDSIDLFALDPEMRVEEAVLTQAFAEIVWERNKYDDLLREVANDETRAFFISIEKNILVAPYNGGIDFIVKDSETRDIYKEKYKRWLSKRDDGL